MRYGLKALAVAAAAFVGIYAAADRADAGVGYYYSAPSYYYSPPVYSYGYGSYGYGGYPAYRPAYGYPVYGGVPYSYGYSNYGYSPGVSFGYSSFRPSIYSGGFGIYRGGRSPYSGGFGLSFSRFR